MGHYRLEGSYINGCATVREAVYGHIRVSTDGRMLLFCYSVCGFSIYLSKGSAIQTGSASKSTGVSWKLGYPKAPKGARQSASTHGVYLKTTGKTQSGWSFQWELVPQLSLKEPFL